MRIRAYNIMTNFPAFIGKTFRACIRMQRRVNRQHNSLTVEVVKRPEADL